MSERWNVVNIYEARKYHTHFLFSSDKRRFAIADHSITDLRNPATTDEGLLLLDPSRPACVSFTRGYGLAIRIPVHCVRGDEKAFVMTCENNLEAALSWLQNARCKVEVAEDSQAKFRKLLPFCNELHSACAS